MALLLYTWKQLELYLKWALGKNSTVTESPAREPYPGIFVEDLSQLNRFKRNAFMCVVGALFLMAFFGNLSTIYVNTRRKLRPFFRACLLSLAFSDLVSSVFCSVSYIAQFHAEYLQLWTIGSFMCRVVPFVTTLSVLSGSLSLVAIATDRYLAVMRPVLGFWNPDIRCSCLCVGLIWLCSIGASAPLLGIYGYQKVYLLELETESPPQQATDDGEADEKLEVTELELVSMCLASDHNEGLFYVMLFALIFLPCIVSFLWLNTVIARQLWVRRHYHQQQQEQHQDRQPDQAGKFKSLPANSADFLMPSTLASAMGVAMPFVMVKPPLPSIPSSPQAPRSTMNQAPPSGMGPAAQAREARHRRMVVVVLLMMAVFICLRLPAWIFLIMRLYGSYSEPIDWLLYFSFGILNLLSCALNPLFYTFLTQTIRTVSLLKQKTMDLICCRRSGRGQDGAMPTEPVEPAKPCSLCCCCGLRQLTISWRCYPAHDPTPTAEVEQPAQRAVEMEADPSSLQRVFSFKHDIFTIYNRRDESQSASIESSA